MYVYVLVKWITVENEEKTNFFCLPTLFLCATVKSRYRTELK